MRGVRRQLADWEEIFTTHLSKTGLKSALRKNFKWIGKIRQPNRKRHIGSQKWTSKRPLQFWWVLTACAPEWGKIREVGGHGVTPSLTCCCGCVPPSCFGRPLGNTYRSPSWEHSVGVVSFPGVDPVDTRMCVHQEPHTGMFRAGLLASPYSWWLPTFSSTESVQTWSTPWWTLYSIRMDEAQLCLTTWSDHTNTPLRKRSWT